MCSIAASTLLAIPKYSLAVRCVNSFSCSVCNYLGNRAWTLNLDWKHKAEFNDAEEHDWNNGAGLARTANGLTFLQVYQAGHMVPTDQPAHALEMISQHLDGREF